MDIHRNAVPKSRGFKKGQKKLADQFARQARGLPGPEAEELALTVLREYCRLAREFNEPYYLHRFCSETVNPGLTDDFGWRS